MELTEEQLESGRYRREDGKVIVEAAVKTSSQLFNERDPAPFRERDLDENFVTYVLSSVQEFPLATEMRLRIVVRNESDHAVDQASIKEAIRSYFDYEAKLVQTNARKRWKTGRFFSVVGLAVLFVCLGVAQLIQSLGGESKIGSIVREGFVIIGWVAMWRPVEVLLYDWWPLREQKRYMEKISQMSVDIHCEG